MSNKKGEAIMSSINRALINLYKDHRMEQTFNAIENRDGLLNANSIIPNQAFPTHINDENKPACIYFSKEATQMLDYIKRVSHKVTVAKEKYGKTATQMEFVCYGYRDHNDDVVIYEIACPYIDNFVDKKRGVVDIYSMSKATPNKGDRIDSTAGIFDYLHNNTFTKDPIGKELVAMLGIIRPENTIGDKKNAPTLKEISDIVAPGDVKFNQDISTGLLIIPPADMERTSEGIKRVDASMECLLLEHSRSQCGYANPSKITNITQCVELTNDGEINCPISKNKQKLSGLPTFSLTKSSRSM